ncbi:MAG: UDP-N-acetylmuramate dehydrogenase [Bacteroidota bacterium]
MIIHENFSLKKLNTFGVDASARYFLKIDSVSAIQNFLNDKNLFSFISGSEGDGLLILGEGSNILFTKNFDGVVVKNNIKGIELLKEDEEHFYVKVGAGEKWHEFVTHCIQKNYAGVENLSLIPGSVGAAPVQNIGAYGVEQKDVCYEVEAIDMKENKTVILNKSSCHFDYRDSIFKHEAKGKFIITFVTFKLFKKPIFNISYGNITQELEKMGIFSKGGKELSIAAISQAVCNIRINKLPDPKKIGNVGSFFKNPVVSNEKYESLKKEFPNIVAYKDSAGMKLAAGFLIEQCGWKGKQFGDAGVYKYQSLVLVNYGNARGSEILELSEKILQSVKEKFGVELAREVVII